LVIGHCAIGHWSLSHWSLKGGTTMTETELQKLQAVERIAQLRRALLGELRKVIVGQTQIIEQLLIALLAKGHCLLIGVPGLAKTLLVSTLARVLDLTFKRIQFTPDLMPSDILGTDVLQEDPETGRRRFEFLPGTDFRPHHPRRRNQPRPTQDAISVAGSDARAQGDGQRAHLRVAPTFLRLGDPKPD
jgi:hypothetical protein